MSEKSKNEPFGDLMKSMNQFFHEKPVKNILQSMDDFFKNPFPNSASFHVELKEKDENYVITAELPGINREQIQLDVINNYVKITVKQLNIFTTEDENQQITKKQQSFQQSTRTVPLPHHINEKKVKATYENGLLTIKVPKEKGKRISLDGNE
ncbi:Hsp20/alpha crystallin family protein [Cytobacillus purgationiresistens]|uniref:HSP20 family molecular chaperone IbpA n=1 Tax=Cytobacillus purgationiresistens TaxID=863449 RepID=A0ABU0AIE8_9BACI|nr:Hsp20/alpha crystallin family protein [Cytobacillus purgationiresistens]MDQ0271033.1 HSP20 family molecular chaperone IbpA [Cytobacillus purgationiresistens]